MHFSYGNVCLKLCLCTMYLDSVFKSVLPKCSNLSWQTSMLYSYIVLLINVNETIYLYGNLPFFKILVNHFMALGDSPGAILWVLRHFLSLLSRLLQSRTWLKWLSSSSSSSYITSSSRLAGGGPLSAPFWCLCQKLSLSLLYFNKT